MIEEKKIGLVLSGGGIKSLAHVGFLKVLLENNIRPNIISGTSGGALVGALYSYGYSIDQMVRFFKDTPIFKMSLLARSKPGIIDSAKYVQYLDAYFDVPTFEYLKYPLTITTTNISSGALEYFNQGDLLAPLIASAALPPYFSPIAIGEDLYSDGGILNNFPVEPLHGKCDILLGSFVNPVHRVTHKQVNSIFKFLQRVYTIGLDASYYDKFKDCDYVFLPPEIDKIGLLETKMIDKAFSIGYQHALKELENIQAVL